MLQLPPQSRILLAPQPVDCRKGIDGLAAVCRQVLNILTIRVTRACEVPAKMQSGR
jgi:hypothetical protein